MKSSIVIQYNNINVLIIIFRPHEQRNITLFSLYYCGLFKDSGGIDKASRGQPYISHTSGSSPQGRRQRGRGSRKKQSEKLPLRSKPNNGSIYSVWNVM
jgi:hypothetical protein